MIEHDQKKSSFSRESTDQCRLFSVLLNVFVPPYATLSVFGRKAEHVSGYHLMPDVSMEDHPLCIGPDTTDPDGNLLLRAGDFYPENIFNFDYEATLLSSIAPPIVSESAVERMKANGLKCLPFFAEGNLEDDDAIPTMMSESVYRNQVR
jgi:hypothetical protein